MDDGVTRDDLAWIRSLMAESQSYLTGTWTHQLVWGLIGCSGMVATWGVVRAESFAAIPWIWAVLVGGGWIYSLALASRGDRSAPVRNVAGRAFAGIWMGLGITLTLLAGVALGTGAIQPRILPGVIALIFGSGYFASGLLTDLRWLTAVGTAWWAGGVGLLLFPTDATLLILAAMTLLLEVGPALALRRMERRRAASG